MDVLISAKVAAIFLLILGNAFFVASEIALTSARRSRIAQLASEGDGKRAHRADAACESRAFSTR
jgi:CBS domain containing-hemolysin-like protein